MIGSVDGRKELWRPLPQQAVALACPAKEVLFGGSKASGKSAMLIASVGPLLAVAHHKFLTTGVKQMNCRVIIFRRNLEDMRDLVTKSFRLYPAMDPEMGPAGWHDKDRLWRFTSGATVQMRHLDGPRDHEAYNGNEFTMILFDEIQFIPYEAYSFLLAQLRSDDPDYRKLLRVGCTANPGGPHGDWVKRHWQIDDFPAGGKILRHVVTNADGKQVTTTRAFIRGWLRDNPYIDPDGTYEAFLRSTMGPDEVRQYLDGDFDVVAGAMFSYLIRPQIHFVKSFSIPATWELMHSTDWGSSAPACTGFWALDPSSGCMYGIDELHTPGITGSIYGEKLLEKINRQKWSQDRSWRHDEFWGVIDTQAMDKYNGPATPAAGIGEHGIRLFPAKKLPGERLIGINQIKERLLLDRFGKPKLVIFEDRMPNTVRALKAIMSCAPIDPEDYDMKSPLAHAIDQLRFACMEWPVEKQVEHNPVDAEVARWERVLKAQRNTPSDGEMTTGY